MAKSERETTPSSQTVEEVVATMAQFSETDVIRVLDSMETTVGELYVREWSELKHLPKRERDESERTIPIHADTYRRLQGFRNQMRKYLRGMRPDAMLIATALLENALDEPETAQKVVADFLLTSIQAGQTSTNIDT